MYFKDTESKKLQIGMRYEKHHKSHAFVMNRKNIISESRTYEDGREQTVYIYDEVQFNTSKDEEYVSSKADDLYRMMSGSMPTIEERLNALEKAIAEIGGLL